MQTYPLLHPNKADFTDIRFNRGLYIDKTPYLRRLLATGTRAEANSASPMLSNSHQFLARPRRFGKSLLINTLEAWFQGLPPTRRNLHDPNAPVLPNQPAAWNSPAWLWAGLDAETWHGHHGWHPVIRLDMSRLIMETPEDIYTALQLHLRSLVRDWEHRIAATWDSFQGIEVDANAHGANLLQDLIGLQENLYGTRPVVLVDEYDAPLTNFIGTEHKLAPIVKGLRDFYRVLKDDEGRLYCVFATGITRFARTHLFSAVNNMTDISEWDVYAGLCGFTEAEVERDLAPHRAALQALEPNLWDTRMRDEWRGFYAGYRFAAYPDVPRVYNPFTLLSGLNRTLESPGLRRRAAAGRWPSAWSETGHPGLIVRLASDAHRERPPGEPADGLGDLKRPDYPTLMLETGYYTWHGDGDDDMRLDFPNREVAQSWMRDILSPGRPQVQDRTVDDLHACLRRGDVDDFARRLETFAAGLARENLRSEAAFRTLLQSLFILMGEPTQSEKSTRGGRSDHEITVGHRTYVIEVKYNRSAAEGLRQIRDRPYGREHLDSDRTVTAVALAFRHNERGAWLEHACADLADLLRERDTECRPPCG